MCACVCACVCASGRVCAFAWYIHPSCVLSCVHMYPCVDYRLRCDRVCWDRESGTCRCLPRGSRLRRHFLNMSRMFAFKFRDGDGSRVQFLCIVYPCTAPPLPCTELLRAPSQPPYRRRTLCWTRMPFRKNGRAKTQLLQGSVVRLNNVIITCMRSCV